jgi:hypothetical protein
MLGPDRLIFVFLYLGASRAEITSKASVKFTKTKFFFQFLSRPPKGVDDVRTESQNLHDWAPCLGVRIHRLYYVHCTAYKKRCLQARPKEGMSWVGGGGIKKD